jgi:choline dehydrogenase
MRRDFDAWETFAGPSWSYDALLPLMKAIETDPDFADSPLHGSSGPMHLDRAFKLDGPLDPPIRALMEAAHAAGLPDCPDLNVAEPFGICSSPYSLIDGRRLSTSTAYLDPARGRSNLDIRSDTTVRRLVTGKSRIRGVEVGEAGSSEMIEADEVVLAAGTYHSPQLLMLSGIGAESALSPLGIAVDHRLDGVGENHQDHAVVYVTFEGTTELHEEYVIPKVRLLARSDEGLDHSDLHVFMRPTIRMPGMPPMLPVSLHLLEHRSRGRVSLVSTDPEDLPLVDSGLLRHPDDIQALVNGIGFADRLTDHPSLAAYYGKLLTPASKDQWRDHVMTAYDSYHHGVGTCRIGPDGDPGAVVDPTLRVHGLDNLMVADASVLPTIPHANTNVAAILVGEIAARHLAAPAGNQEQPWLRVDRSAAAAR